MFLVINAILFLKYGGIIKVKNRKETIMKKPLHMLTGVNIGDYEFVPDTILDVVKKYKFGKENEDVFKFLTLRMDWERPTSEQLYEWARYFKENEIYFVISGNFPRYGEQVPRLTDEEMEKMREIAGEYFMGNKLSEFGGFYATRGKGYNRKGGKTHHPIQGAKNCLEAKELYEREVSFIAERMRKNGSPEVGAIQAVTLTPYDYEAGVDYAILEVAPRNMEQIMSFGRGAARANKKEILGAWLAHEFYGGFHQFDPLKAKRFTAEYYSMYLAGIDFCCLESGYRGIHSHVGGKAPSVKLHANDSTATFDGNPLPEDHPLVKSYLKEAENFAAFCNSDIRPGKDGPITKVAFVQGNLDGFGWGNSSSLWGQYYDEKWGFSAPEFSYRVLDEVYHSCEWNNGNNFGDYDYSNSPAYGQYDVIPATTPLEVMKRYEWVIFCGWNTMTSEIYETLKAYVKGGGKLLITAAHMRDSIDRAEKGKILDENWEELLGVKLTDEIMHTNDGYKFVKYSTVDGIMYPGTHNLICDPAWSAGYTDYVKVEPTTATPVCYVTDCFLREDEYMYPVVTENKHGDGSVIFMANSEYPGAPEIFPLYKIMVKAILAASHRCADVKVIGSDKIRFAVYEDEKKYKVYIFNSDFNFENRARIIYKGVETDRVIPSVKLEIVELEK